MSAGVGPGAPEPAAARGLVLGERDGAVGGVRRQHPLGRLRVSAA